MLLISRADRVRGAPSSAALSEFLQVGSLFAMDPLMPKLDKLNPIAGMKNMFSKKSLVELIKSCIKITVTAYVVYGVVRDAIGHGRAHHPRRRQLTLIDVMGELVYRVALRVVLLFLVFAIFDIWWQHRALHEGPDDDEGRGQAGIQGVGRRPAPQGQAQGDAPGDPGEARRWRR